MKILNCSWDDYANFAHNNATALRTAGSDCVDVKIVPHPFGYINQSQIVSYEEMKTLMKTADVVQIFHSALNILDHFMHSGSKAKLIVYHTGSPYRMNPGRMNSLWNDKVSMSFTDQTEFMTLGAKNLKYIATAIDTTGKKLNYIEEQRPYTFAHFPSNPLVKGTVMINDVMNEIAMEKSCDAIYYTSSDKVPYLQQIHRMSGCDIYIELFMPELNGKQYGCFGVTAFEAAALGKVVISQNMFPEVYEKEYGECPFFLPKTKQELKETILNLIEMPYNELRIRQMASRNQMLNQHSYMATGTKILKILSEI